MSPRSKKEYIETIYVRYRNASRNQKTLILDELCATLGYHRKHAIRVLRKFKRFRKTKTKRPGRAPLYSQPQILKPLKKIWLAANLPCSKRLKIILRRFGNRGRLGYLFTTTKQAFKPKSRASTWQW